MRYTIIHFTCPNDCGVEQEQRLPAQRVEEFREQAHADDVTVEELVTERLFQGLGQCVGGCDEQYDVEIGEVVEAEPSNRVIYGP